jgi:hypothetical protein
MTSKSKKSSKPLHHGKKLEAQKPLSKVSFNPLNIPKNIDKSSN